ncbi:MAG TPA: HD-GYP domain-containing protein [Oxalicibacterium sp.]|nr:HD-GYP domain-containing protein [Oxalicibacterium sp.]
MNLRTHLHRLFNRADSSNKDLLVSLLIMAWVVEARDPYTGGHLWRVSRYAHRLSTALGMSPAEVARVTIGGFLHDLGKVGIPDHILNKKDRLTDEEYEVIRTHPDVGWRMLAGHPLAYIAENAIRSHHEMPNGRGYPQGLAAGDIPRDALIVGVCDAFDAMTSTRPYRKGMPIEKALAIIESELGKQFDAEIGAHFIRLGRLGEWDHIVGHTDLGIPLQVCGNCGPTIVVRREQRHGEHVYCRSCSTEFVTQHQAGQLTLSPTGRSGQAKDVEPLADLALIARLLDDAKAILAA